jgi:hypothetical protein
MTGQAPSTGETVAAFLLRVQEESAAPLVRHCAEKVPNLKRPLQGEYARFRKRFRKATASLRTGIGSTAELSKPASQDLIRQFEVMGAQDVARTATLDPLVFCSSLRENLSRATRESIQKNMESAFAQYKAAVADVGR